MRYSWILSTFELCDEILEERTMSIDDRTTLPTYFGDFRAEHELHLILLLLFLLLFIGMQELRMRLACVRTE